MAERKLAQELGIAFSYDRFLDTRHVYYSSRREDGVSNNRALIERCFSFAGNCAQPLLTSSRAVKYPLRRRRRPGGRHRGRWFSQSRGSYNSNPNLSNCPRSSHYTADLIQTFVVVVVVDSDGVGSVGGVKAKFRTAQRRDRRPSSSARFARSLSCISRVEIRTRAAAAYSSSLTQGRARPCRRCVSPTGSTEAGAERRENYIAKLPISRKHGG